MKKVQHHFDEYLHEYAVWTAARAVQRGFQGATTANVKTVINQVDLKALMHDTKAYSDKEYNAWHCKKANEIIEAFKKKEVTIKKKNEPAEEKQMDCSYGRAAKIIAIYIKTAIIIPNRGQGHLAKVAHPPIDAILLKGLHDKKIANYKALKLQQVTWTKLNKCDYFKLIEDIRTNFELDYFWELERYWNAGRE